MKAEDNLKRGERVTVWSALASGILAIMKILAGTLTGSVVLITSALDSFSDLVGMLTSWFGFRISQRKPDERFPFGYYKAESIATLFVSVLIIYAALSLLLEGYSSMFKPPSIQMPFVGLAAASVSLAVSFGLSRYMLRVGRKINSDLLITNSRERMADVGAASAVFAAVVMSYLNMWYVEAIITIIISLMILRVGVYSAKDAVFALMDMSPSREKEREAIRIVKAVKDVEEFENPKLRKAGPFAFGEVTIRIKESANIERAHAIADEIEKRIKSKISEVVEFTVHIEPFKSKRQKLAIPVTTDKGLDSPVTDDFSKAACFVFVDIDDGSIKKSSCKKNPAGSRSSKAEMSAVHFVIRQNADALVVNQIREVQFHTLRDHLVDIYRIAGKTAKDVVDLFIKEKLVRLTEHSKE